MALSMPNVVFSSWTSASKLARPRKLILRPSVLVAGVARPPPKLLPSQYFKKTMFQLLKPGFSVESPPRMPPKSLVVREACADEPPPPLARPAQDANVASGVAPKHHPPPSRKSTQFVLDELVRTYM